MLAVDYGYNGFQRARPISGITYGQGHWVRGKQRIDHRLTHHVPTDEVRACVKPRPEREEVCVGSSLARRWLWLAGRASG